MKFIVGFSRASDWWKIGSQIIQAAEKRPYSHAYIRYEDPDTGIILVAQASHGFVNLVNFEIFKQSNTIVEEYEFNISVDNFVVMLSKIQRYLGVPYSKLQLFLIGIKKLLHFEVNIHNYDQAFICSEFVVAICEAIGLVNTFNEDYLTPSDLNKLIRNI